MSHSIRVFVGWDQREPEAYDVCRASILRHASQAVEITPIKLGDLVDEGLYTREIDPLASTEFTYSRFLTPHLAGFSGWALFCDCDFLFTADIAELWALREADKAVMCVQHDYRPKEATKMDGRVQTTYPRKNWSSLMLFNCEHPATRRLTVEAANGESPAWLHRMNWAADAEIGALPETWNWLEGWSDKPAAGAPSAIHFTRGGPWFDTHQDVDYAELWREEARRLTLPTQ